MSDHRGDFSRIVDLFCAGPAEEIDPALHPLIRQWSNPPTAVQVFEVIDKALSESLASEFVIGQLTLIYEACCEVENVTHEEVVQKASKRSLPN